MQHKTLISLFVIMILIFITVIPASANPITLNWGSEVNPGQCQPPDADPVISIVHKVVNDVDSGEGGNWAFDHYTRQIQVWQLSEDSYCALGRYEGHFDGVAGQFSPGDKDRALSLLTGAEDGAFQGGFRLTVSGSLKATPDFPIQGHIGNFDYQCDINANCPGRFSFLGAYFEPDVDFDFDWWGWVYHGGRHGTWANSIDGNLGNILDD